MMHDIAWDDRDMLSLLVAIEREVINENKSTARE